MTSLPSARMGTTSTQSLESSTMNSCASPVRGDTDTSLRTLNILWSSSTEEDSRRHRRGPPLMGISRGLSRQEPPGITGQDGDLCLFRQTQLPNRLQMVQRPPQIVTGDGVAPKQHPLRMICLIHISEPTRRTPISYAVFCL